MKLFNKKAGIKKLVLLTNMALMSFIMPTVANAETLTPTLGNNSAYTINQGSASDYTFKTGYGEKVQYHKVNFKTEKLNSSKVQWRELPNSTGSNLMLSLPHNGDTSNPEIKYYAYTYTKPVNYYIATERIVDNYLGANANHKLFQNWAGSYGGAIYNSFNNGDNIVADFVGNSAFGEVYLEELGCGGYVTRVKAFGGAIDNTESGVIGNITGDFIGNYATVSNSVSGSISDYYYSYIYGGAIYNAGTINSIIGDFIGNNVSTSTSTTSSSYSVYGGAIYNAGTIDLITGDFIGNYAKSESSSAYGGAICNAYGTIGDIKGDFISNYTTGYGGAISNGSTIGDITGDFIGNYAVSTRSSSASGGAIDNSGTIYSVTGDFIGNYASSSGGAISNDYGKIGTIIGDFIGNYALSSGGAIYNYYTSSIIREINADFIGNYVKSESGTAEGGAIDNSGTIKNITGDFIGNYASASSSAYGGAIYNSVGYGSGDPLIESITGNFFENYVQSENSSAYGGAIFNSGSKAKIGNIIGDFIGNYASSSSYNAYGGAIYNSIGTIGDINGSFLNNYAQGSSSAYGGAIWTNKDLNFVANNRTNTFTGNYIQVGDGEKQYEAIYVNSNSATLTFNATNGGKFVMDDYTNGVTGYNVKLTGDGTGTFELNNQLKGADVTTENITVDLANDKLDNYTFNTLTSSADTKYELDVDLVNRSSDAITTTNASSGVITITSLNVLNDLSVLTGDYVITVLDTQNSDLQLALSEEIKSQMATTGEACLNEKSTIIGSVAIKQLTNWDDVYAEWEEYSRTYGTLKLATSSTANDSIEVSVSRVESGTEVIAQYDDTLAYVNQNAGDYSEREFKFDSAENVYTVKENLGNTAGKLTVNGVADGDKKSTIDVNGKNGFVLNNRDANLVLNNVVIKNANNSAVKSSSDAQGSFNNVEFANNTISAQDAMGGAISNNSYGKLNDITNSTFTNNNVTGTRWVEGGAIWNSNYSKIGNISANFYYNSAISNTTDTDKPAKGGAIYNNWSSTIASIAGEFVGNKVKGLNAHGGAIFNNASATITSINGTFENNYAEATTEAQGGAIWNAANIGTIDADFTGNYAQVTSSEGNVQGGAIYNTGTIHTLNGDFSENYAQAKNSANGGVIYNSGTINSLNANFEDNYAISSSSSYARGGAIYNTGTIDTLNGDFSKNYAQGSSAYGGAIYNNGTIGDITGDFYSNYAKSTNGDTKGGAIYNEGTINNITGDFYSNYLLSSSNYSNEVASHGGAINNLGVINVINGNFSDNSTFITANYSSAQGGSIRNTGLISEINANFINNKATSNSSGSSYAGAIMNAQTIGTIIGNFIENYSFSNSGNGFGGAIVNLTERTHNIPYVSIDKIEGNFIGNYVKAYNEALGGAIHNWANGGYGTPEIKEINAYFKGNYVKNTSKNNEYTGGGAISNRGYIENINANFDTNYATGISSMKGGAIYNYSGTIENIIGDFIGNYASSSSNSAYGGAIYNGGTIGDINGSFLNNYAQGSSSAKGGAIYTNNDLTFVADNKTNEFTGNYVQIGDGEKQYEAIYVDSNSATLTFNVTNDGKFVMNDYTNGTTGYNVKLTGDGTGTFELNNQLKGADVVTENITVDLANDKLDNYTFNTLTSSSNTKYELDVDFLNKTSDTITTSNASTGVVTITGLNVLGDLSQLTNDYKIKVLNTQNSDLQLALSDEIQRQLATYGETYLGSQLASSTTEAIKQATNWNDTYAIMAQYNKLYGSMGLATTTTTNDSIGVTVSRTELGNVEQTGTVTDTLAYVNKNDGGFAEREFNFNSAENVYTVKENLGNTAGKLTVNGVADGDKKSTIDFNRKTGFMVNNSNANLIVNHIELKNATGQAIKVTNNGKATINNVVFSNNLNSTNGGNLRGGALHVNNSEIASISANFINNKADSESGDSLGGAISNDNHGKILEIKNSVFKNNVAEGTGWVEGGALWNSNYSTIGDIQADFYYNKAVSTTKEANGGAIYNNYSSSIGNIVANFVGNNAEGPLARGGAIMNNSSSTIESITGNFENNHLISSGVGQGGAIYNATNIGAINADFTGNYIQATSGDAQGGAIYNTGTITAIVGNFVSNYSDTTNNSMYGGTIYNKGTIGDITGNFQDNYGKAGGSYAKGGAILNEGGKIQIISGNYSNNKISAKLDNQGGAIANIANATIAGIKDSTFVGNSATGSNWVEGGAILNWKNSKIGDVSADFIQNSVEATSGTAEGGAIANMWDSTIGNITGNFVENSSISKDSALGGAIANKATIGDITGSFVGNWAESKTGTALGGAIYTTTNLNLIADNKALQIRDNYTVSNGVKDDNAIYVDNANATLTFNIKNNGSILLKDNIDGATGYKFNVTGDNTGMFYLQNDIRNANVSMGGITLNTINNQVFTNHFNSFTLTDTINMAVDVDLANGTMDRISADTFGEHNGSLNVIGMNLISDMASDVYTKNILFAEGSLKEQVTLSVNNLPDSNFQTTLLTPIYKYNVSYDKSGENGMFVFARPTAGGTGSTGNASDAFNPAILAGSTSAAVGAVGTVNQAVHHSFNNVDAYMNIPYMERMAMKRRNHYALASVPDDVRQLGKYSPLYLPGDEEESVWVKPYTTFESVPLKNGPKVSNISYGTLVGFDSQMQSLRHGWDRVISGYVGYTGASQRYSGVDATQNGGILGGTVTLYKGNFFNATTLNVGSSVSQNETMYGKDDYTMLMSGIANKTGYNLEFKDGKVILQPSMLVGYTFVNTFDYTNAAGVKIDNKPLHTIQVSPGVKVIGNLKHGWQPYASVNMVWNLMGEYDATANGVKLPEMKVKPYVQYGVGLQKRVKDHFMAYGQAMLHNGGRNGISLTAGFRWALGHKDNCDYEIPEIKAELKNTKVKAENKSELKIKKVKTQNKNHFKINKKKISNAK